MKRCIQHFKCLLTCTIDLRQVNTLLLIPNNPYNF